MKSCVRTVVLTMLLPIVAVACGDDVTDPDPSDPLTGELSELDFVVEEGETVNVGFEVEGGDPDSDLEWSCSSSNPGVVSVETTSTGCSASAVGAGTATVTVTLTRGGETIELSANVEVLEALQPSALVLVSGDGQSLEAGEDSESMVVEVRDQNGDPMEGIAVAFEGSGVEHTLSATTGTTGVDGRASVTLTAGAEAGEVVVVATTEGIDPVSFTIEVEEPPVPSELIRVSGNEQRIDLEAESEPLVVEVLDEIGAPIEGVTVHFESSGVEHELATSEVVTGVDGRAQIVVTAGTEEGTITVDVSTDDLGPISFQLEVAEALVAAEIVGVSGDEQLLLLEEESAALVVEVRDQYGDPLQGVSVTFEGSGVDHDLSATSMTTGATGRAQVTVTAGTEEGEITVEASVPGAGSVSFTLNVEEPALTSLVEISGDGQTINAGEESAPLVVEARDQKGNPLEGVPVSFDGSGVDHTLSAPSGVTDAEGRVPVTVTAEPGAGAGMITVQVSAAGPDPVFFTIDVEDPLVATSLAIVSGDPQTIEYDAESDPLVVEVLDQNDDPLEGVTVSFSGTGVAHTLSSTEEVTGGDGRAQITLTAGTQAGQVEVDASVDGLADVTFTISIEEGLFSIPSPADPRGIAWDGTWLWVVAGSNAEPDIFRLDPADGSIQQSFDAPAATHRGLTWDGTTLWYSSQDTEMIYQLDPANGNVLESHASPGDTPRGMAWDGTALWLNNGGSSAQIFRIDPSDGSTIESIPTPVNPLGLTWDGSYLWSAQIGGGGALVRVDPEDGSAAGSIPNPGTEPVGVTHDASGPWLWVSDYSEDRIYRVPRDP